MYRSKAGNLNVHRNQLGKDDDDRVKRRMCEVDSVRGKRRLRKTWNQVAKDIRQCGLNKVDA